MAGNIDIHNRPVVRNRDGSISTVRTISIGTDKGEVLIPTVIGNRVVSDDEAIREYERTGKHLGIFRTPDEATSYAKSLHNQQEQQYAPKTAFDSSLMDALITQESGGRAGVLGPQTQYGRAQGLTQMLPATAEGVARKLGVPWRPDLMTGTSKEAAAYQRALGQAYLAEGVAKTGNIRDGLRYYHGGPNRNMWGSKTNRYADSILSRMGSR